MKRAHTCDYKAPRRRGGPARGSANSEAQNSAIAPNIPGGTVSTSNASPVESSGPIKAGVKRAEPDPDEDADVDAGVEYEDSGEEPIRASQQQQQQQQQQHANHPPLPTQRHLPIRQHQTSEEGMNGFGPGRYVQPLPTAIPPPPSAKTRSSGMKIEGPGGTLDSKAGAVPMSRRNSHIDSLIEETLQSPRPVPRERDREREQEQRIYVNENDMNGGGSQPVAVYPGRSQQQPQQQLRTSSFSGVAGSPPNSAGPDTPSASATVPQAGPSNGDVSVSAPATESVSAGGRRRPPAARGPRMSSNYGPKVVACNFCRGTFNCLDSIEILKDLLILI